MKASCRPMTHRPTDQVKVTVTAKSIFTSELIVETRAVDSESREKSKNRKKSEKIGKNQKNRI